MPAAVVVAEPTGINLPALKEGDVFYGEFTLTNYGLVRADNLVQSLPPVDEFVRYELVGGIPNQLGAKERITVAYRAVALTDLDPDGSGTGGGCFAYTTCMSAKYDYECANGVVADGAAPYCFSRAAGTSCDTSSGSSPISIANHAGFSGAGGRGGPIYTPLGGTAPLCLPDSQPKSCPIGGNGPGNNND